MKSKTTLPIVYGILLFAVVGMSGCAVDEKVTLLKPVGPEMGRASGQNVLGYLVVYTATENPINKGDIMYYPHTGYTIYDAHGAYVRFVRNRMSSRDENPSQIELPPGNYTVRAESEIDGSVAVPVLIKGLRTTVVNLEKRSHDPIQS